MSGWSAIGGQVADRCMAFGGGSFEGLQIPDLAAPAADETGRLQRADDQNHKGSPHQR